MCNTTFASHEKVSTHFTPFEVVCQEQSQGEKYLEGELNLQLSVCESLCVRVCECVCVSVCMCARVRACV